MFREILFFVTFVGHFLLNKIGDARNFGHTFCFHERLTVERMIHSTYVLIKVTLRCPQRPILTYI